MGLKIELVIKFNGLEIVKDGEVIGIIRVDPLEKKYYKAKLDLEFKPEYKINRIKENNADT